MTASGDIIYGGASGTPTALPIGSTNQVLAVVGGLPAWTSAGGGDVTGPAGATDGDFVVFSGTTGKIIAEPTTASFNNSTGRATFNGGVDVGVSSSDTGTLVFRNSANAFTTTIQASTSASANAIYSWPQQGTATNGNLLANDGSGNLFWTSAGAGNVTTSGVGQVINGSMFFLSNGLEVRDAAQTRNVRLIANAAGAAGTWTATFPTLTGTVALLDNTQTFLGNKIFQAGVTLNTAGTFSSAVAATFSATAALGTPSVTINPGSNFSVQNPHLLITSTGTNITWMGFGSTALGGSGAFSPPVNVGATASSRSAGTKIVLYAAPNATSLDIALGVESGAMWLSAGSSATTPVSIKFYVQSNTNNAVTSIGQFENSASCYGLNIPVNGSGEIASLLFSGTAAATHQYIRFNQTTFANPSLISAGRSRGTRIILSAQNAGAQFYDFAIGGSSTAEVGVWFTSTTSFSFWSNNSLSNTSNNVLNITGGGILNLPLAAGRYQINGTQVVGPRDTGYVAFTGTTNEGTTYATGTVTLIQLAERVAAIQASLTTHGLIGA